ncbi:MAG: PilZ domain-containing protein, partial [Humidesulfovibrio sp.]|nr:PilZ domain-containing protein [Humidesulfovibrio sp.]
KRCNLDLVDISSGGARLRVKDSPLPEFVDNRLSLSIHGIKDNGRLQNLSAQIRWRSGQEVGVQFENTLDMPLSDLQRLVG